MKPISNIARRQTQANNKLNRKIRNRTASKRLLLKILPRIPPANQRHPGPAQKTRERPTLTKNLRHLQRDEPDALPILLPEGALTIKVVNPKSREYQDYYRHYRPHDGIGLETSDLVARLLRAGAWIEA